MAGTTTLTRPRAPSPTQPLAGATQIPTPTTVTGPALSPITSIPTPTTTQGPALSAMPAPSDGGTITHGDPPPLTGYDPKAGVMPSPAPMLTQAMGGTPDGGAASSPLAGALAGYTPTTPGQSTSVGAVNGIDPVQVNATPMTGYQPFIDNAYSQATRNLDPQWNQAQSRFDQDMVNRGIAQGSEAYNKAWDNFSRAKTDAYGAAQSNAFGQGLAAQGQSWGQGAQQAALAQAMRQWSDQFGLNRDQLDANIQGQLTQQQMDAFRLNQGSTQQQFMLAQALLGMIPGMAPAQIDTYSPYGLQTNAAGQNAAAYTNQQNGLWGALGQLGSAWLSSRGGT